MIDCKLNVQNTTDNVYLDELNDCINNNTWLEYFSQCDSYIGENWIDFESEISRVIQALYAAMKLIKKEKDTSNLSKSKGRIIGEIVKHIRMDNGKGILISEVLGSLETFLKVIAILDRDLNRLIRGLEIYLCEFVEKLEIKKKSPDIDKLEIDYILSFNYTHIFSQIYNVSERSKKEVADPYDYIHGEAYISNCIETNNMVLGIDEYLGKKRKNKEIEYIAFKKYYQRIYKGTGCKYKDWLEVIKKNRDEVKDRLGKKYAKRIPFKECYGKQHNLYIFGHSLDVTDKDILRDLILNDNVYTTIFYRNQEQRGQQIANLVKVIGQNELIRRTGGSTKTIEFKLQKDMVERI